ncbi:MAG: glutathione S-transferase family protein [Bdellovibrionaceae bacterium]|nr:glutathione S-transferase family protein [Bdellovibrionales bacterium]MCB9255256.1 glutathione S-transferase family protein [Pseudobdellovibrionaceae bacterium]
MVTLFGSTTLRVLKPLVVAEELSIHYEQRHIDLVAGEHRQPAYLAINAQGRIPVLEHEGRYLSESNAIARYMADMTDNSLYPKDAWTRAEIEQWIAYFSYHVERNFVNVFFNRVAGPKLFGLKTDENLVNECLATIQKEMPYIDSRLAEADYLCGDTFTLADVIAFCDILGFEAAKIDLAAYQNFQRWYESIKNRESVKKHTPKLLASPF